MDSAKPTLAVALADERLGKGWQRSRTRIRVVAVLASLLAALIVYALFDRFRVTPGEAKPERLTIASVDLRVGNPAGAAERGEAKARADVEAGELKLQTLGWPADKADIADTKRRYGVVWTMRGEFSLLNMAYVESYNKVMYAEIERRHGKDVVDRLRRIETAIRQREG
ncbi:hypothetical protein ACS5PN_31005 [Roseateles sp. NT4]|uniref:hypothetical protein n=1 Tax=Roseateles sp. NT4 TaxID=3453715 RepID=UPI003EEB6788